jgi:DNA (cytosine-5)-methyltransferase 1
MRQLNVISLFTGAGGLDAGFAAAGFRTAAAVDTDKDCCATLRTNWKFPVLERDVHSVNSAELLSVAGISAGDVRVLTGRPPCQPFSKSAYWTNGDTLRLKDQRANTLHEYMRLVEELLPDVFLLENVHGINYSGKEEGFVFINKMTERINATRGTSYEISWRVVNAADYGVPQIRERFFLVACRDGHRFRFPPHTHRPPDEQSQNQLFEGLEPYAVAWDAIGNGRVEKGDEDLTVKGQWADLLPSIPEGDNYLWHTKRKGGLPLFGWRTRFWSFLLKLAKRVPSWTIQAQPGPAIGPFHWENRRLSVAELAALQTFPLEYGFVGSRASVQRQLGNAVPSLLAEVLAREIRRQCFGGVIEPIPRLALKPQRPIPPPESVRSVPQKFLYLIGDHEDHPGTGKGRAAKKRKKAGQQASRP